MKTKLLFSTILGAAAWSLSHVAVAGWVDGPCPQPHIGPAPCIEAVYHNGSTDPNDWDYHHFNGDGSQADRWKGAPRGGDFEFVGSNVDLQCLLNLNCTLTLRGEVKKCQDSNGDWRIGVRVNSSSVSGIFPCGAVSVGGFPWYSKDHGITPHCEFANDCDDFILYNPSATSYFANFGKIDVSALGVTLVDGEHVHEVEFTPGLNASFAFDSFFYDCEEDGNCHINGVLSVSNVNELNIY